MSESRPKISDRELEALLLIYNIPSMFPSGFAWSFWLDGKSIGSRQRSGYYRAAGAYLSRLRNKGVAKIDRWGDSQNEWYISELGKEILRERLKEGMEVMYRKEMCTITKVDRGYIDLDVIGSEGYYNMLTASEVIDINI